MSRTPQSIARIAYLPWFDHAADKGYTLLMRDALADFGDVVRHDGLIDTWRRDRRRLDAIVVNWTDNDLLDRRTRRVALRKVVKLFARTIALRLVARRLVFVRHNVYPHATAPGSEDAATRWVDRYESLFDAVVTHSGDDTQKPRSYCPHPLYRRLDARVDSPLRLSLPPRYFVVFGRIVRYKHLERLMAAFPEDERLLVIGAVGDRAYAAELVGLARPNVLFRPGLIDEAEAQAIVGGSTALVIAHADPDVVVSSSFFFAMSLEVPVLAIATPFLRWIAPRVGDAMLRLANDVEALCTQVRQAQSLPGRARSRAAIDREFGTSTVRAALRPVVLPPTSGR